MGDLEIPPEATIFVSRGETYFLYMSPMEMVGLQREWGVRRDGVDTSEEWQKKLVIFNDRLKGGAWEDKLAALRHGLTRWAKQAGNGSGPVPLDDEKVAQIVEGIEHPLLPGTLRPHSFMLVDKLHERFYFDAFGYPSLERLAQAAEGAGPKDQENQSRSTPSGS